MKRTSDLIGDVGAVKVSTAQGQLAATVLEQLTIGVLVVAPGGGVQYANAAARELFGNGRQPVLQGGCLAVTTSTMLNDRLQRAIVRVAMGREDTDAGPFVLEVDADVAMIVARLDRQPLALVLASNPTQQLRIAAGLFRQTHGLTRAEVAVVATFLDRPSTAALAAELGVTTNTARTHLKRVFDKLRVRSRAELMRALLAGPLRLLRLVRPN